MARQPSSVAFAQSYFDAVWADPGHDPSTNLGGSDAARVWLDGGFVSVAVPAMNAAVPRLDIVIYGINLDPGYPDGPVAQLADAVKAAAGRGVSVRILFEHSDWSTGINQAAAAKLDIDGVEIRFDSEYVTTHARVLLVDAVAFVGTNNWSFTGLALAHEMGVRFEHAPAVADLEAWFEVQWSEASP